MDPTWKLEISLEKTNASYKPYVIIQDSKFLFTKEIISGSINFVSLEKNLEAQGGVIKLTVQGQLSPQNLEKNRQFKDPVDPLNLFLYNQEIQTNLCITPNENSYPFSFKLEPKENSLLLESYQGLFLSVEYAIIAEFKYTAITGQKAAQAMKLFFVQINVILILLIIKIFQEQGKAQIQEENLKIPNSVNSIIEPKNIGVFFYIQFENFQKVLQQGAKIPKFNIKLNLFSNTCIVNEAIEGYYIIEDCEAEIKLAELQLIRIETIGQFTEGRISFIIIVIKATEVQVCQIAEGDVLRKIKLPLYMTLPRSYICPNFSFDKFKVNFEVIFALILKNGYKISQSIPLYFYR